MRARTQRPVYSRRTAWAVRPFEPLHQCRDSERRWIGDEQVHVVSLSVELDQFGVEFGAHGRHGVRAEREHLAGEHGSAV